MSRFSTKQELLDDATDAWRRLADLLATMPAEAKLVEITDGMTSKDFVAHRAEWGRMMLTWYAEASAGGTPAVPSEDYGWGQLQELNAEIHERFMDVDLADAEAQLVRTHDRLIDVMSSCSHEELFTKKYYSFTRSSDLATYFTSATGGHYRSAYKHINRWWRANKSEYDTA